MKNFFIIIILLFCFEANATIYYVSNSGNNSNNGTTNGTPWQTIGKVNGSSFSAGDQILFNRGDEFDDAVLTPPNSGSAGNLISFGAYGSGADPVFSRIGTIVIDVSGLSYLMFDNLNIFDPTMSATDHTAEANISYGIGGFSSFHHITIQNCNFERIGIGIEITGTTGGNIIQYNRFYNLRMVVNTPTNIAPDDDYGANGIVMSCPNNTVTHNSFANLWGDSFDYGLDGAAIECFTGNCDNNNIGYNYADSCAAWTEQGSSSGGNQTNLNWYYNLIINCGQVNYVNGTGGFSITPVNNTWYNNVIVQTETPISDGTPGFFKLINGSGTFSSGAFIFKNNIFKVTTSSIQYVFGNSTGTEHENNIYQLSGGAAAGLTLDASELSTSSTLWVSTSGNAATWNYHLAVSSPAINFGQDLSITPDYGGTTVVAPVSAGLYQYSVTPPTPPVSSFQCYCTFQNKTW